MVLEPHQIIIINSRYKQPQHFRAGSADFLFHQCFSLEAEPAEEVLKKKPERACRPEFFLPNLFLGGGGRRSRARIVYSLAMRMKEKGAGPGLATLCIDGGQGMAMVLERD